MLMNQLHSRSSAASSSSSSVAPNIEAVVIPAQHHQQFQQHQYMKKSGKIGSSSCNNNNSSNKNPLGRFLPTTNNKLPKSSGGSSTVGDERSFHDEEEEQFRQQRRNMVHNNNNKLTRKESMSRSHSWIYGSVKQTSSMDGRPFDFGRPGNIRDHMPSYHLHHNCNNPDYCYDCSDLRSRTAAAVASSSCMPSSSVRLKDRKKYLEEEEYYWKHFAFNDCPEHSPLRSNNNNNKQVANNCENNNNNNTKKFVGSVRKLTWKSLKQVVVKKRPSLDNVYKKQQQNPPPSVPPATAPDILFVPNYFFPPVTKQNFYASCTDLCYEDQFPHQHLSHLPTASVRVRPKQSRQPWPCEFGPLPNYHEERSVVQEDHHHNDMRNHVEQQHEEEEDTQEIYHSEWDLRQFMPYDVWLSENSPLQSSNPNHAAARLLPKVKANSHTETAAAVVENSPKRELPKTSSLEGQGYPREDPQQRFNRQSILQSDITAYELNRSDEEISSSLSSFDSHSNSSSEDLKNDRAIPYHCRKLLPRVNGKFSQKSTPDRKTSMVNNSAGTTIIVNGTKVSPQINTRTTTNSSKTPVPTTPTKSPSDRKLQSSSPLKTIAAKSTNNNRVSQTPKSSTVRISTTPASSLKSEEVSPDRKTSAVKVTSSIREAITEGNKTENVRKNALKRNNNKLPSRPSHQNSLGETPIHEEENGDDDDDGSTDEQEPQQHIYAVKILVSQNNPSSLDTVKPILKRESVYETPSIQTTPNPTEVTPTAPIPEEVNNSRKKVQFDQSHPIVCGGLTDDGGTESDDTLVWDDHKVVIDGISQEEHEMEGKEVTTTTSQVQATISWSDEQEEEGIIKTSSAFNPFGVNNLTGEEKNKNTNNHRHQRGYPTEEKKKTTKEDIKVEGNRNELLHSNNNNNPPTSSFPNMKANRMVKTAERKTVQARPSPSSPSSSVVQIMNPNSLLFHDTTRIRLNQSRPSIDQTFKINVGGNGLANNGSSTKATRLKQSSSFRQMGSTPLRPREPPPPPPPPVRPAAKEPKPMQISGQKMSSKSEKRASGGSWSKSTRASLIRKETAKSQNGTSSSPTKSAAPKKTNGGSVKTASKQGDVQKNNAGRADDEETNIEIVTKENSVSEIRIYSGTQNLNINRDTESAQVLKNYGSNGSESQVTSTVSEVKSRPQSTSVVLIIDTSSSPDMTTEHCSSYAKIKPMESPVKSVDEQSLKPAPVLAAPVDSNEQHKQPESNAEPLYDDVIARAGQAEINMNNKMASLPRRSASPPPLPSIPPPLPSVPPPSETFIGTGPGLYNKIRSIGQDGFQSIQDSEPMDSGLVYDDTISVLSSSYGTNSKVNDDDVPLYDDVLNLLTMDSDSGAETEEAIPPPLPTQRPTLPLPKVSTDLPMLNFPLLTKYMDKLSGQKDSKTVNSTTNSPSDMHLPALPTSPRKDVNSNNCEDSDDILDRTRSLLNELSQKFNTLKFTTPADYATYISKVLISSSSDSSSGVEEDYGSEKNYPISDSSSTAMRNGSNLASRSGAPALEALINARDRFLDTMKTDEARKVQEGAGATGAEPIEEPIYEEIGDEGDDLNGPIYSDAFASKSMFDGASRNEILTFLEAIRERLSATTTSDSSSNSLSRSEKERAAEIERNDSGIGSGSESGSLVAVNGGTGGKNCAGSKSALSSSSQFICMDCNDTVDTTSATVTTGSNSPTHYGPSGTSSDLLIQASSSSSSSSSPPSLCQTCTRKRRERKEILQEIYETEVKYGRDLRIIQEEFYNPIQIAGLLTRDQLEQIFLNVDQLVRVNTQLTGMLKSTIDEAVKAQDEDLTRVNVGKIFMEYGDTMMSSFENYCTQQASAGALLTQLEKEKELLRIFLRVSQMENSVLRRMNLPAFLMVPVQRVTRYPLLMARLLKVTPSTHPSRAELFAAQVKIEQHLESMNKRTREASSIRLWRRISIMNSNNSPAHRSPGNGDADDSPARIRKMALDVLDWANFTDVTCVAEGSFDTVEFNGKPLRNIHGCFLVRGKNLEVLARRMERPVFFPPKEDLGIDAKLVLVRIKNARFCLLREPLCLSKCVISQGENEYQDCVEINEITSKNTLFLRMNDVQRTAEWLRLLQCHAACCGHWRRRRGALANIMMNGMIRHL